MKILFLHGLESSPGGKKARYLEGLGHTVLNPALPKENFEKSVEIAQKVFNEEAPDVVVGSSRGGAIAMAMNREATRTILIAPAYKRFGVVPEASAGNEVILHSIIDDIVPIVDSANLVTEYGFKLHVCGEGHRMSDADALKILSEVL